MSTRKYIIGAVFLLALTGLYGCDKNAYSHFYAIESEGDKAWNKGNYQEAFTLYEQSLQELETIPDAGYILISRRADYAKKLLDYAVQVDPTKFDVARYEYEKILKREIPVIDGMITEAEIMFYIAISYTHEYHHVPDKGPGSEWRLKKAIRLFNEAVDSLHADRKWSELSALYNNLAYSYEHIGEIDEAIVWAKKKVALEEHHAPNDTFETDRQYLQKLIDKRADS